MTFAYVITQLSAHNDIDDLGMNMIAAATTLRDSTGHERKQAVQRM